MIATLLAIVDPGDEVIVFEPFYENYGPDTILSGATPRFVRLRPPADRATGDWWFDPEELAAAFTNRTRAIIINTPNNPTGKVFTRAELEIDRARCASRWGVDRRHRRNLRAHRLSAGARTCRSGRSTGMADRTVAINSTSKTFSVTGWRVGWAVAPPDIAPAHPQGARLPDRRRGRAAPGRRRRGARRAGRLLPWISRSAIASDAIGCYRSSSHAGFPCYTPHGAYYIMTDVRAAWASTTTWSSCGTW